MEAKSRYKYLFNIKKLFLMVMIEDYFILFIFANKKFNFPINWKLSYIGILLFLTLLFEQLFYDY